MSPISPLVLQRSMRQLGRIRTGNTVPARGGRRVPSKLTTFRLTSVSRVMVEAAQEQYGGEVVPWDNPSTGKREWEVILGTDSLDILVPRQPVTQWMELWKAGGCIRRCTGEIETISNGPCLCPHDVAQRVALAKEGEACKTTTRLKVILPALPDMGVWMLETHSFYAATELAGVAEILAMANEMGRVIPARLRLEQRSKKVPGEGAHQYGVPIIELQGSMTQMGLTAGVTGAPQVGPGAPARPLLPATTPPASSDLRAPTPLADGYVTLTPDDFRRLIDEAGITVDAAMARAAELFPERPQGAVLTSVQLAALWADLSAA